MHVNASPFGRISLSMTNTCTARPVSFPVVTCHPNSALLAFHVTGTKATMHPNASPLKAV